jgi:hypothetical protein
MKKSALAAFLTLAVLLSIQFNGVGSPYHIDNILLKNFQAIQVAAGAKVVWEFTSEELDVTVNLEKSVDGISFTSFRTFHIASTRQQALHSYLDKEATGQTFYRLRITKQSYIPYISPIVSVNMQHQATTNAGNYQPAVVHNLDGFLGELSTQDKVMCVRLVDMSGQAKLRQYLKGTDLERVFRPSFNSLPAGYYVLNINDAQNKPLLNKCIYKY